MATKSKKFEFGQRISGFSLLETLIVISIVSILCLLSFPSLKSFIDRQQLNQAAMHWLTKIRATRLRALKTQKEQVLEWDATAVVTLHFNASFGRNKALIFQANGFTQGQQGSLYVCLKTNPDNCRRIVILASGVARVDL